MQTSSVLKAALLAAIFACGSAQAVPQSISGVGFDITWDSGSLGAGWTAALSGEPESYVYGGGAALSYTPMLTFSNSGAISGATWSGRFSVTVRPKAAAFYSPVELFTATESDAGNLIIVNEELTTVQAGHTYATSIRRVLTGGVVKAVSSAGFNTLPAVVQLPSAYGYNQLGVTATAGAQTFSDSHAILYLDANSGNSNSVVINPPGPRNVRTDQITSVTAGEGVLYDGRLYIAQEDMNLANDPRQFFNPARWINSGFYVPPTPFGGEIDVPVELTLEGEVWTPTFMQPSGTVRHCAVVDCMVAANGQYRPRSFSIALSETLGQEQISVQDITTPVPEPGAGLMLLAGLGLLGAVVRRRRAAAAGAYFAGGE